jgi:hypothetical protein
MPYTACPHEHCCSEPSPLVKASAQLPAGYRCCPLLSPASCPRHAPRAPLLMSHLSLVPYGAHPTRNQPVYRGLGCLPTAGRPALFLAVSASVVSKR